MKNIPVAYDHVASAARIDALLAGDDVRYEEPNSIPPRDHLTFANGFYVKCSALFIDLRGSSTLPNEYKARTLAKVYRSYISEAVAVLNGNSKCAEIMIVGDCVSAVFDTPHKEDCDTVFETAAMLNSLIHLINCRLARNSIQPIRAGIGLAFGPALMIKAGYQGSTLHDVVWMGHVVNRASKLCSLGSKQTSDPSIVVDDEFATRLNDVYRGMLKDSRQGYFTGGVVNKDMEKWRADNCS